MPWADRAAAVLCTWFPGQEFGPALAAVLGGALEPGGRLPVTFARDEPDYLVFDLTPIDHDVVYEPEPTIGYRHFDQRRLTPRFGFGHGLGYASFTYADLAVAGTRDGGALVSLNVTNTSDRPGKDVVQVYARAPHGTRALELKGFSSMWLQAGETQRVEVALDRRAFRHWVDGHGWQWPGGTYQVLVGPSSQKLPLTAHLEVPPRR
jgi:beta-glucosidase